MAHCVAANCKSKLHIFKFPDDETSRAKWFEFISQKNKDFQPDKMLKKSGLCWQHFEIADFENFQEYKQGYKARLFLRRDIKPFPSIHIPDHGFCDMTPRKLVPQPHTQEERHTLVRKLIGDDNPTSTKIPRTGASSSIHAGTSIPSTEINPKSASTHRPPSTSRELTPPLPSHESALDELELSGIEPHLCTSESVQTQTDPEITGLPLRVTLPATLPAQSPVLPISIPSTSVTAATSADTQNPPSEVVKDDSPEVVMDDSPQAGTSRSPDETKESSHSSEPPSSSPASSTSHVLSTSTTSHSPVGDDSDTEYEVYSEEEEDYDAEQADNETIFNQGESKWYNERKFMVCYGQLIKLLEVCHKCAGRNAVELIVRAGCYVRFKMTCTKCGNDDMWANSDEEDGAGTLNLLLSCGILFSGSLPAKILRALNMINVAVCGRTTYFKYQRQLLFPAIDSVYDQQMEVLHRSLTGPVKVNSDGRFDSPGHAALFMVYSVMDCKTSKILASELVKSTETTSSPAMELLGLERCREYLESKDIKVEEITTDRHISINAYIKKHWKDVSHLFDLWHLGKGLTKKISKLSGRKVDYKQAGKWRQAIVSHLYKVVESTPVESDLREEQWKSTTNHICNVHEHDSEVFPACLHGILEEEIVDEDGNVLARDWINPDGELATELRKILLDKKLVEAIGRASQNSTSELESFHSALNRNMPKMESFTHAGMTARLKLTLLHHNENCERPIKMKKDGTGPQRQVHRSKATAQKPTVQYVREDPTYAYADLLFEAVDLLIKNPQPKKPAKVIPTLASKGAEYVSLDALEEQQEKLRRGLQKKAHFVAVEELQVRMEKARKKTERQQRKRTKPAKRGTKTTARAETTGIAEPEADAELQCEPEVVPEDMPECDADTDSDAVKEEIVVKDEPTVADERASGSVVVVTRRGRRRLPKRQSPIITRSKRSK